MNPEEIYVPPFCLDAQGFDDFEAGGVWFNHHPARELYKVHWPDGGVGRMREEPDGWHGYGSDLTNTFGPVPTREDAVRRLVARAWDVDPEDAR